MNPDVVYSIKMVTSVFVFILVNVHWQRAFVVVILAHFLRLARHYTPVTTVDELWNRSDAAGRSVPVHAIQSLFDSMLKHINAVISARGGCSGY
ncbi:hypothetical protein TNCV_4769051 [Trichonephila clavipes]|nr:hypothetical protein TNCV_4769051 [Trichonephila clavipes]